MTKNLYYRTVGGRPDVIYNLISFTVMRIASYPRLLLEVFIRQNFGERYFRMSAVVVLTALLITFPIAMKMMPSFSSGSDSFWLHYATWYLFTAAFFYVCLQRWKEVKHEPSVYDFKRFSFSNGRYIPQFSAFVEKMADFDVRKLETVIEPALFFVIGLILALLGQRIGALILVSSIVYSLSYVGAYRSGDNFIMNMIDEMLVNESMKENFVEGTDDKERDFRVRAKLPNDPDLRQQHLDQIIVEEEKVYAS